MPQPTVSHTYDDLEGQVSRHRREPCAVFLDPWWVDARPDVDLFALCSTHTGTSVEVSEGALANVGPWRLLPAYAVPRRTLDGFLRFLSAVAIDGPGENVTVPVAVGPGGLPAHLVAAGAEAVVRQCHLILPYTCRADHPDLVGARTFRHRN